MMKILITGGAGYLGSVTVMAAAGAGHQVRILDNLLHGATALPPLMTFDGFEFLQGDIRNHQDIRQALRGVEAVVHLAAIVGDPACAQQTDAARLTNLDASFELIRLAEEAGVRRFIFASTCSNYGRMQDSSTPASEEHELRPLSFYAESKVAVERHLLAAHSGPMHRTVLRFATLYGVSPRMRFDLTVNEFTMRALTEGSLRVYGEQFWRPYVHVRDAARAILAVLEAPAESIAGRVFNVGDTGENYRKQDLVDMIRERIPELRVDYVKQAEDPRDYRVSFERIRQVLNFCVTRKVPQGIREIAIAVSCGGLTPLDDPRKYNTVYA
jgi:nucleoside-diphosphate-sugar epimerase